MPDRPIIGLDSLDGFPHGEIYMDRRPLPAGPKLHEMAEKAETEWVLILGDDTILHSDYYESVRKHMRPEVGMITPRSKLFYETEWYKPFYNWLKSQWPRLQSGAWMAQRETYIACEPMRECQVGDDWLFHDWCLENGWEVVKIPDFLSTHSPNVSMEATDLRSKRRESRTITRRESLRHVRYMMGQYRDYRRAGGTRSVPLALHQVRSASIFLKRALIR